MVSLLPPCCSLALVVQMLGPLCAERQGRPPRALAVQRPCLPRVPRHKLRAPQLTSSRQCVRCGASNVQTLQSFPGWSQQARPRCDFPLVWKRNAESVPSSWNDVLHRVAPSRSRWPPSSKHKAWWLIQSATEHRLNGGCGR